MKRLLAVLRFSRAERDAVKSLFARMAYPNFGLGRLIRNATTGIGDIDRAGTEMWRT